MGTGGALRREGWGLGLALVLVALSLRVLVPPGFMPGSTADGGFPLVICTGHGPALTLDGRDKAPAHPDKPDAPCAFAGHVLGPTPDAPEPPASRVAAYTRVAAPSTADLAPGRGLAAPPPPATGPPAHLL